MTPREQAEANRYDPEGRLEDRIIELERWQRVQETHSAVFAEQLKSMKIDTDKRFDKLDDGVAEIKNATWKVVWVIGGAFVAAAVTWIVNGGMAGG